MVGADIFYNIILPLFMHKYCLHKSSSYSVTNLGQGGLFSISAIISSSSLLSCRPGHRLPFG
jgi:hypothetical protein